MYLSKIHSLQVIRLQKFFKTFEDLFENCLNKELKRSPLFLYFLTISVAFRCPESTVQELEIKNWPIWACEASYFVWIYDDKEIRFLLEGEVTVPPVGEEPVKFCEGDLVVFLAEMKCMWDLHKAVCKYYRLGD